MPKVFPIQDTKFPIQTAREYGHIQQALNGDLTYPTGKGAGPEGAALVHKKLAILSDMRVRLADFDPVTDYLLIIGDPILIGLALAMARDVAEEQDVDTINVLRYDKALGRYLDIEVEV